MQYGLYGDSSRYAAQFLKFADLACKGTVNEEMFKQIFGVSYARMDRRLIDFTTAWSAIRTPGFRGNIPPMPNIEIKEASQSDVARIKADVFFSEGNTDKALDELRIAFWRGERAPRLLAALADLEARAGDLVRARRILAALTQMPAAPARGVLAGARIRFNDAKAALQPGQKLPATEAHELLTICATLARNSPAHEELYALIAEIALLNEMQPDPQVTAFLRTALDHFPDNATIREAARALTQEISNPK